MGCSQLKPSQPDEYKTWTLIINSLTQTIKNNSSNSDLISSSLWVYIIKKYSHLYFKKQQQLQFLSLITTYYNGNHANIAQVITKTKASDQYQFCAQIGEKLHKIYNKLNFYNQSTYQIIHFLIDQTLFTQPIPHIAKSVCYFYQKNSDSFAILSLFMLINVQKQLQIKTFKQVQNQFKTTIINLQTQYPPSKISQNFAQKTKVFDQFVKDPYQKEFIIFQKNQKSKIQQVRQFIMKKVQGAEKDYQTFWKLIKQRCYRNGYGLKSGLKVNKIKGQYNIQAIQRTIQKITDDLRKDNKHLFQKITQQLIQQYSQKQFTFQQLIQFINKQKQQVNKVADSILQKQQSIIFDVKDLVRGKCVFQKIQQLIETVNQLITTIRQEGYSVIDLKNRFKQKNSAKATNDLVLIIKLPHSIAQLQLVLKLDSHANQFNHKLYELQRSSTYSLITNLYIQNQRWCQKFFNHIQNFLHSMQSLKNQPSFKHKHKKNKQLINKFTQFQCQNLHNYEITQPVNNQQRQKQMNQVQKVCNDLIQLIKSKNFVTTIVNEVHRLQIQKRNQINLLYSMMDYKKASQHIKQINPTKQINTYPTILNLNGLMLSSQGKYAQALQNYNNALTILQKHQSTLQKHEGTTTNQQLFIGNILNNIGIVHQSLNNYAQAFQYFTKCLQIKTKLKGQTSIDVAITLQNIGITYKNQRKYDLALEVYNKSLQIQKQLLGQFSIEVAMTLQNMAILYSMKSDFPEALKLFNKSLQIRVKTKGQSSVQVSTTYNNLGNVHASMRNFNQGLKNYQKCIQIDTKIKGYHSLQVAQTMYNTSILYFYTGQYQKSLDYCQQSYKIRQQILGSNHPQSLSCQNHIQKIRRRMRRINQ